MSEIITLMMVTYNRLPLTKRTLEGLGKSVDCPYNLVIVDNGSTDGTVEYLDNLKVLPNLLQLLPNLLQLIIHKNVENKGIAIGRNQCLKIADDLSTDWYCTIDNDVEMPDGWLSEAIEILKANRRYGAIGVNMEKVEYPIVTEGGKAFQMKPKGNLGTACMVFPKSVHKMLGFFTTEYGKYGEEDSDFGMRITVIGFKLGYIRRMGVHFGDDELDTGKYREFKTKSHEENKPQFFSNCSAYFRKQKPLYIPYRD